MKGKSQMKLLAITALVMLSTGCAPVLGAHVHRFEHAGTEYVKCTVTAEASNSHVVTPALEICREAFGQGPQPQPARH